MTLRDLDRLLGVTIQGLSSVMGDEIVIHDPGRLVFDTSSSMETIAS